jgi:aryl-alcohol dehydrogenase-like predicted oxidoreductase
VDAVLEVFIEHIRDKYRAMPALTTKNLPLLCDRLKKRGLSDIVVMASFNAAGFYMNPSAAACATAAGTPGLNLLAMNTLASGALKPDEAYRFLGRFPAIKSVVVGTSRVEHAAEAVAAVRQHLPALK